MNDLVNILTRLQKEIQASGITVQLEDDQLRFAGPAGSSCLSIVQLYRPSSDDVVRASAPDVLLVLTAANQKAVHSAAQTNYILMPQGGYRIVAPGIALIHDSPYVPSDLDRNGRIVPRRSNRAVICRFW